MKLLSITFGTIPRIPGLRPSDTGHIDCDKPPGALQDWRVTVRGQQVFFISPPGWQPGQAAKLRATEGPITVHEVPRAEIFFAWSGTAEELEGLIKGGKYESPPFGWKPPIVTDGKPILEQIPAGQVGDA